MRFSDSLWPWWVYLDTKTSFPTAFNTNQQLSILKLGIQVAGKSLRELVKQLRNPFKFPTLVIRKGIDRWRQARGVPKLTIGLEGFLHPSLGEGAKRLEYAVHRLQYIVEMLLQRHGAQITDAQLDLQRVANIVIDIYVMTAVLSRASRSYCTGINNAGVEVSFIFQVSVCIWIV